MSAEPHALPTVGQASKEDSKRKNLAIRHAAEMGSLIAERDALENEFEHNPKAVRHTLLALDKKINDLREHVVNDNIEEPFLGTLPPQSEEEQVVILTEKKYFPKKEFPEFNFAGRILGPKGSTIRSLEKRIPNCKLAIRGRGSRPLKHPRRQPYEPDEELHLFIMITDTPNRASSIMEYALKVVAPFFNPVDERADLLKDVQMRELAHIRAKENGSKIRFSAPFHLQQGAPLQPPYALQRFFHPGGIRMGAPILNMGQMSNLSGNFHHPNAVFGQAPGFGPTGGGGFGFGPI